MKKVFFCKLKTLLARNLRVTIHKHFGDFVTSILRFCCRFSMKIIVYLPVNTVKPKLVAFLVFVCMTASFIAQISSSENVSKRYAILTQVAKQSIAKDIPSYGANQNTRKVLFTDLVKIKCTCKPQQCTRDTRQIYKTRLCEKQKVMKP